MSRSGYSDDYEHIELYRGTVERALQGKRGQAFLGELADAMNCGRWPIILRRIP